jgi:hypothetical protein
LIKLKKKRIKENNLNLKKKKKKKAKTNKTSNQGDNTAAAANDTNYNNINQQQQDAPPPQPPSSSSEQQEQLPAVEIVDISSARMWKDLKGPDTIVKVKSGPYSKSERDTLLAAVQAYAKANNLDPKDTSWLFSERGKRNKDTHRGAWKVIASSLPDRTVKSVWSFLSRALHPGNYKGRWTIQEDDQLRRLVQQHPGDWKKIGAVLQRMPQSCKDRYKEVKLGGEKRNGPWMGEEEGRLKMAVEKYLVKKRELEVANGGGGMESIPLFGNRAPQQGGGGGRGKSGGGGGGGNSTNDDDGNAPSTSAAAAAWEAEAATTTPNTNTGTSAKSPSVPPSDRRMTLDDIDWNYISAQVRTRSTVQCIDKWYNRLAPTLQSRGDWGEGDDKRLLKALYQSGATKEYEVEDWGALVPGRSEGQCKRRWKSMVKVVPGWRDAEMGSCVGYLVQKYMPKLLKGEGSSSSSDDDDDEEEN